MERAVNIIMAVFVLFEAIQGYRVIKKMIEQQASKFHVQQFDNLIEMQEMQEESMEEIGFMPHWKPEDLFIWRQRKEYFPFGLGGIFWNFINIAVTVKVSIELY